MRVNVEIALVIVAACLIAVCAVTVYMTRWLEDLEREQESLRRSVEALERKLLRCEQEIREKQAPTPRQTDEEPKARNSRRLRRTPDAGSVQGVPVRVLCRNWKTA